MGYQYEFRGYSSRSLERHCAVLHTIVLHYCPYVSSPGVQTNNVRTARLKYSYSIKKNEAFTVARIKKRWTEWARRLIADAMIQCYIPSTNGAWFLGRTFAASTTPDCMVMRISQHANPKK